MFKYNLKKVQYIFLIVISFFSAIYLMYIINEGTLTTNLQRIFISFYFLIVLLFILFMIKKKYGLLSELTQQKGVFVLLIALSLGATIISWKFVIPYKYVDNYVTVEILDEKNVNSKGKEAWLTQIKLDGSSVSVNDVLENSETDWQRDGNVVYANKEQNPEVLMLRIPKKKHMELQFTKHAWSGMVEISFNNTREIYDLYDGNGSSITIDIPTNVTEYSGFTKIMIIIGIFCTYFIILYIIFTVYLKKKEKITVSFVFIIICLLSTFIGYIYIKTPQMDTVLIQPLGEHSVSSKGSEVWVTSIEEAENSYDLKNIELPSNWFRKDNVLGTTGQDAAPIIIQTFKTKPLVISFVMHPWSGKVCIQRHNIKQEIDLYSSNGDTKSIILDGNQTQNTMIVLSIMILWGIGIMFFLKERKEKILDNLWLYLIILFCMCFILCNTKLINMSFKLKIFFGIVTFSCGFVLARNLNKLLIKQYFDIKIRVIWGLSAIYSAFATFGYKLFLAGEYISVTLPSVGIFICAILWYYIIILSLFCCLEWLQRNVSKEKLSKEEYRKVRIMTFSVLFIIWELILFSYRPGNLSSDSTDQWLQAMGIRVITPTHSALLALIIRFLITLIPSPMFVLTVQIIVGAAVFSQILTMFHQSSRKLWITLLITFVVALVPNNYTLMTTLWKDIPFSLCMVVLTCLLYEAAKFPESFWTKKRNIIYLAFVLIGVKEFRQNGILIFAFSMILLGCWMIKYKLLMKRILLTLIITAGSILLIHGPVFSAFNVNTASSTKPFITMFAALGSAINKGKTFSEETTEVLYKIMKQEDWVEYYSPFNIDSYRHNSKIDGGMDINKATFKEAFSCYLEGLEKYPTIIIKDRLDGSNIIWDVTQPINSFNFRYSKGVWMPNGVKTDVLGIQPTSEDGQSYQPNYALTKVFDKITYLVQKNKIADIFIFRSGIYLVFYVILLVFSFVHKKKPFYVASIPVLGNVAALMLLCAHQSYRYVWNIPLCVMTLFVLLFLHNDEEKEAER